MKILIFQMTRLHYFNLHQSLLHKELNPNLKHVDKYPLKKGNKNSEILQE